MAISALWSDRLKSLLPKRTKAFLRRLRDRLVTKKMHLSKYPYPIFYRTGTSDAEVISQVLDHEEYSGFASDFDPRLIIDCGANIGCTSFYYLCKFPSAQVIAIEPDDANVAICRRNLAPFRDRVRVIQGGVWPTATPLRVEKGYRDGREWAYQVSPCTNNEPGDVLGTTIESLLNMTHEREIDLLKIDVEGAELPLFTSNFESWLSRTRNIVIELHDGECSDTFFRALKGYDYELQRNGDLTVCQSIKPRASS
jgi:FkbM family methyltransferase